MSNDTENNEGSDYANAKCLVVLGAGLRTVCTDVNFSLFLIAWYNINICGNKAPSGLLAY